MSRVTATPIYQGSPWARLQACNVTERILARLSRHQVALTRVKSTVSIGIATHDGAAPDFSRMYRDADAALYQARVEGKSCIGVFTPWAAAATQGNKEPKSGTSPVTPYDVPV